MRKTFLSILIASFFFLFALKTVVLADTNCKISTTPNPVTTDAKTISFTVQISNFPANSDYKIKIGNEVFGFVRNSTINFESGATVFNSGNQNSITVSNVNAWGQLLNANEDSGHPFENVQSYQITLFNSENTDIPICSDTFSVIKPGQTSQGSCTANIGLINGNLTTADKVKVTVVWPAGGEVLSDKHDLEVKQFDHTTGQEGEGIKTDCVSSQELINGYEVNATFPAGTYIAKVMNRCGETPVAKQDEICAARFNVCDVGQTGCGIDSPILSTNEDPPAPDLPCLKRDEKTGDCLMVATALGDVNTSPDQVFVTLFTWILGAAGSAAFIIFLYSGYKLMMSGGDKEKVQGARDAITSAIVGLLFIIFSFAILEFIGVDILRLPGFGK